MITFEIINRIINRFSILKVGMESTSIKNENKLILDLINGSEDAFTAIYYEHRQPLIYQAFRFLKSEDQVEEVIQNLFLKLWEKRDTLHPDRPIRPLLNKILHNLIIDFFRKLKYDTFSRDKFLKELEAHYSPIEIILATKEKKELLHNALEKLPELQRNVFICFKLEQKSYKEIEEMYGLSKAAIHSYIYRTNVYLKSYFRHFDKSDLILILLCIDLIN